MDGRSRCRDCTAAEEGKATRAEEKRGEMNDEALHYAMIGGCPKEKQQAIE